MTRTPARWWDRDYLTGVQYRTSRNLAARADLHRKYGRADWMPWLASQVDWAAGARVLDVGCGAGWFWEQAADRLPTDLELTVVDLSPGMTQEAFARAQAAGPAWRVEAAVADAAALPFADGAFDVVMACHMLYQLRDPAAGVAELARVLARDGVALVSTNGRANMRELFALRAEAFGEAVSDPVSFAFSLENGEPALRAAFADVTLRRYPDDLDCADPADVIAYLTSSPPGDAGDAAGRARLEAAVAAAFARGAGRLKVSKDVGLFVCRGPRRD